ncbi:MAG: hypothetical protein PUC44_02080, partial [Eubacteriales bacterium]|nr:hypothetical protein [Eubacteriales bacterium]
MPGAAASFLVYKMPEQNNWALILHQAFQSVLPHLRGSSLFFMLFSTDTGVLPTSHFESFGEDDLCFGKLLSERILHR